MCNKQFNPIKLLLYELFPELYIKKVNYRLEGYCCKCGDCCRYILGTGVWAWLNFKLVGLLLHKYRRFRIMGRDKWGNLVIACRLIGEDGLCPDYENRPVLCRDYPENATLGGSNIYKRCTYRLIPEKPFRDYLE